MFKTCSLAQGTFRTALMQLMVGLIYKWIYSLVAPLAGAGGQEVEPDWRKGKVKTVLEGHVLSEDSSFCFPPACQEGRSFSPCLSAMASLPYLQSKDNGASHVWTSDLPNCEPV